MHIRYVLDTCIVSASSKREPDPVVVDWMRCVEYAAIPMGALVEFEQGIYMCKDKEPHKFERLMQWRIDLLNTGITLLETDARVALQYGRMRACKPLKSLWYPNPQMEVQRGGQDIHIAATAIVNGYCVATFNVDDFMLIHQWFELPGLYNPKTDTWHVTPRGMADAITVRQRAP